MDHTGQDFLFGVISGAIGSLLAVWVLFLLKPLWKRFTAPAPLTVQAKIQIAQYLEYYEQSLRRLNHMAANPKDLYLYLFQITLTSLLLICAGFASILAAAHYATIQLFGVLAALGFSVGLVLSVAAIVEAQRMSEKNIARTRAKMEVSIHDARTKLGNLAAVVPSTETTHQAPSADPRSPGSADSAP